MKIKQISKFAWDEFIYGGHLLALGAVSVVLTSAILLDISISCDFLLIVYLTTYIIYLYDRFRGFEQDSLTNYDRSKHIKKYIKYIPIIISGSTLIIIGMLFYFGNQLSLIFGLLILLFGLFYSLFFKRLTQKIIGFKSFYVSFFWTLLVIFSVFHCRFPLSFPVFLILTFVFLRTLMSTIFFDIKDIESDKQKKLKTIPVFFGKNITLKFLNIINIVSFIPIIIGVHKNILPLFSLSLIIFFLYSFYFLHEVKREKVDIRNLFYVIVDGEFLFWSIALFSSKFIFKL